MADGGRDGAHARGLDSAHVLLAAVTATTSRRGGLCGRRRLDCADVGAADDWRGDDVTNRENAALAQRSAQR
jgi:hypothetical protein